MARELRRLLLLDRARIVLGGAEKLATALGIGRRAVNHKLAAERSLTNHDLELAARALDGRAREIDQLASDIRAMIAMSAVDQ
jgi:hypothetical protein